MTYQMDDSLGGLVFLLLVVLTLTLCGVLVYRAVRHRWLWQAGASLIGIWVLYAVAIVVTGTLSTDHLISLGSVECFDDWCASVVSATTSGTIVTLTVRVMNEAKRAAQSPDHPKLVLVDSSGADYLPTAETPRSLDSRVEAGESFTTELRFEIRRGAVATKALLTEGSGPPLIGDQNAFFHKKTYFGPISGG
jgi:hypothetical protein